MSELAVIFPFYSINWLGFRCGGVFTARYEPGV
jgi:hypothetical protein